MNSVFKRSGYRFRVKKTRQKKVIAFSSEACPADLSADGHPVRVKQNGWANQVLAARKKTGPEGPVFIVRARDFNSGSSCGDDDGGDGDGNGDIGARPAPAHSGDRSCGDDGGDGDDDRIAQAGRFRPLPASSLIHRPPARALQRWELAAAVRQRNLPSKHRSEPELEQPGRR